MNCQGQHNEIGSTRYTSSSNEIPNKSSERNVNDACRSFSSGDLNAELGQPNIREFATNLDEVAEASALQDLQTVQNELINAEDSEEELETELARRIESIIKRCDSADGEKTTLGRLVGVEFDEQPKVNLNFGFKADFDKFEFHDEGNSILLAQNNEGNDVEALGNTDDSQQLGKIVSSEVNTASMDNRITMYDESPFMDINDPSSDPSAQLPKSTNEFTEASRRIGELHAAMLKVVNRSESLKQMSNEVKALSLGKGEDSNRLDNSKPIQRVNIEDDFIPAYKPFQTIEVPVAGAESNETPEATDEEPSMSMVKIDREAKPDVRAEGAENGERAENSESNEVAVNKSGKTVIDTNMNDPQSKQIMRYALLRALQRLEDGTGYFSAKIIITDP
ncbi:hypothetical protein AWZ03_010338 [Drosophila navojoa]|uniref:Uncharacterized protein n=1 Tax=Drosophila navojoa TaxID=7232 RepID=A0A484B3K4_DRONA|nr:hypothetical protein AWZ03_010338 [Drosophila navojoa]